MATPIDYMELERLDIERLKTFFDKNLLMRAVEKGNEPIVIEKDNQFREIRRLKQYNRREILKLEEARFHLISSDEFFVNKKTLAKNKKIATKYIKDKKNKIKQGDIIYIGQSDGEKYNLTGFGIVDLSKKNLFYEVRSIFYRIFQNEEEWIEDIYCSCGEDPFEFDIYTPDEMEAEWEDLDDMFTKYYNMNYSQAIYDIRKFKRDHEIYVSHLAHVQDDGVEIKLTT